MSGSGPRIVLTLGEPAGVGPDIAVRLAHQDLPCRLAVIGDPELLSGRAEQLGLALNLHDWREQPNAPGELSLVPEKMPQPAAAGVLDQNNVPHVLKCLDRAVDGCTRGDFDAMVTGPVHKGIINAAGVAFSGHTEYIAERTGVRLPVMMLVTHKLRVALVTTHVPLRAVPKLITKRRIAQVLQVLIDDLQQKFGVAEPRIAICGLNPHAGEEGYLGREEIDVIAPVVEDYRQKGHRIFGPLPADTAFIPQNIDRYDAVLSMYHDQGLPVIKHHGFDQAVNITLGVPILRTSVDHGTALELAATDDVDIGSSLAAIHLAADLAGRSGR